MLVLTIGEYANPADSQRDLICEQEIDLASGEGVSAPLNERTCSVRLSANVDHRWSIGPEGKRSGGGQFRAANVEGRQDVKPGQAWRVSAIATQESNMNGGEQGLANILEVLGNKAKLDKALKEFSSRRKAAEDAEASLKTSMEEVRRLRSEIEQQASNIEKVRASLAADKAEFDQRKAKIEEAAAALKQAQADHDAQAAEKSQSLHRREQDLKPKELALGRKLAAAERKEAAADDTMKQAQALKAEYEKKLAQVRALAG